MSIVVEQVRPEPDGRGVSHTSADLAAHEEGDRMNAYTPSPRLRLSHDCPAYIAAPDGTPLAYCQQRVHPQPTRHWLTLWPAYTHPGEHIYRWESDPLK